MLKVKGLVKDKGVEGRTWSYRSQAAADCHTTTRQLLIAQIWGADYVPVLHVSYFSLIENILQNGFYLHFTDRKWSLERLSL